MSSRRPRLCFESYLYAFLVENWKRRLLKSDADDVLKRYLGLELETLCAITSAFNVIGRSEALSQISARALARAQDGEEHRICQHRAEFRRPHRNRRRGPAPLNKASPRGLDEDRFPACSSTRGQPDPDL